MNEPRFVQRTFYMFESQVDKYLCEKFFHTRVCAFALFGINLSGTKSSAETENFMREFMTRLSDYINERRNNPESKEGRVALVLTGAVALVVIVLLFLLLWRHIAQKNQMSGTTAALENAIQSVAQSVMESAIQVEKNSEKIEEYLSGASADSLKQESLTTSADSMKQEYLSKQEYLTVLSGLNEKVEGLLIKITRIREELGETLGQVSESEGALQKQVVSVHEEMGSLVEKLKETQVQISDLTDVVQVMGKETLPQIQEQIKELEAQLAQTDNGIIEIYKKLAALKTEDEKLWAEFESLERQMASSIEKDMVQVTEQIKSLAEKIREGEERQGNLEGCIGKTLTYEYDSDSNTLKLLPNEGQRN